MPTDTLREITGFVYFLRQKSKNPKIFAEEYYKILIADDLDTLEKSELKHLEEEFENYEQLYPRR